MAAPTCRVRSPEPDGIAKVTTLAKVPVEVKLRGSPQLPIYQSVGARGRPHVRRWRPFQAIAQRFRVDDRTAAKAVRWFRQR